MAVTPHHYSLPLGSIVKQGYPSSVQTSDPVQNLTVCLTGDLSVCSLISRDPTSLSTQVTTSLLPSLPSHQKIHTHTNIIFSPFDIYFNHSHQFTVLLYESFFSWLAISRKADCCRHNSELSNLFYSLTGFPGDTSPGSLILGWLSLSSPLFLPPSLTLPHIWYPFRLWFSFLRAQDQSRFDAWCWMLGAGALGQPRGMVWGGRREEGSGWGTHVYLWRIHFEIWQN